MEETKKKDMRGVFRTLLREVKDYKTASILTPLCMIGEVIVETLIPYLMASIIDDGVNKGNMSHIYLIGLAMIGLALAGLLFGVGGGHFGARASTGFARNLRRAMFHNIQTYSFSNIDRFSTSGLVTRLTTDVTNVQNAYQMVLRMLIRAPFSMIVAMIMAFIISPKIAFIYLAAVIFLAVVIFFLMGRATKYFKRVFKQYDALNESVQENVSAIRVVKAYVREEYENSRFAKAACNVYNMFVQAEKIVVSNLPIMSGTIYTVILSIAVVGAHLIVQNELTTGNLSSLMAYCMSILASLMMLAMVFVMISMSTASAERIAEVIEEKTDIPNPEDGITIVPDGRVDFDHVNFSYSKNGEWVLRDIDLHIRSGEVIGVLGGTGSSKSSLVNLLSRLYDVQEGSVKIGGIDVREYDIPSLRHEVAVVLQKNVLFSGTILDNLRWGKKDATEAECIAACRMACADEFIEKMPDKYNTWIEQGGTNVSGGQRQRLCIARALLMSPKILILDDSTSAVDTATDAKIQAAMKAAIPGTTKFIISQRISSVEHADRIIVLDEGKVSGFGTPEELLATNHIYQEVYETQKGGTGDFDMKGGVKA